MTDLCGRPVFAISAKPGSPGDNYLFLRIKNILEEDIVVDNWKITPALVGLSVDHSIRSILKAQLSEIPLAILRWPFRRRIKIKRTVARLKELQAAKTQVTLPYISCRGHAGLLEPEGLQRIRQCQQTRRLERMGHAGAITSACCRVFTAADPDQIFAAQLK